ncbi:hypothetical protein [Paracoccus litorisediminis]|uniref:Uncharacterized protein n=1 Tax=Paracoccus litorisediminis TaxID=2006130 RepID=A0A844HQI8_9RHOB|nr:hypothetical protein [Paracoccus litorisediminis]MTH62150.1 hypothetical protein [Paracoccus litorisediminis]
MTNTDSMTATDAGKHILDLKKRYASNDVDITDLILEKFNCRIAAINDEGAVWIEDPQTGHWLDADRTAELIAFLERT